MVITEATALSRTTTVCVSAPGFRVASHAARFAGSERNLRQGCLLEACCGNGQRISAHFDVLESVVAAGVRGEVARRRGAGVDSVTCAPSTTAPVVSCTVPRTEPKVDWADSRFAAKANRQQ